MLISCWYYSNDACPCPSSLTYAVTCSRARPVFTTTPRTTIITHKCNFNENKSDITLFLVGGLIWLKSLRILNMKLGYVYAKLTINVTLTGRVHDVDVTRRRLLTLKFDSTPDLIGFQSSKESLSTSTPTIICLLFCGCCFHFDKSRRREQPKLSNCQQGTSVKEFQNKS